MSLNAQIEAARARESGRGFAVVADKVKKLADETRKASENIAGLIGEIQGKSENTVKDMATAETAVIEQYVTV